MNKHAAALGRLARGVRKTITPAEREARRLRMAEARKSRWPMKKSKPYRIVHSEGCIDCATESGAYRVAKREANARRQAIEVLDRTGVPKLIAVIEAEKG